MKIYQLDAFCSGPFTGNPAAVVPLEEWPEDRRMQNIALENQLSETAFLVPEGDGFRIRWFTPKVEVDLCGHATLAAAAVAWERMDFEGDTLVLQSRSGELRVTRDGELYVLDFPADPIRKTRIDRRLVRAIKQRPQEQWQGREDTMLVFKSEDQVRAIRPDFGLLARTNRRGVIVTSPGDKSDFVSRFFCPNVGLTEDPATGSIHTTLVPYWHNRLGKSEFEAMQLSERGGWFHCRYGDHRIMICGKVHFYMEGRIL